MFFHSIYDSNKPVISLEFFPPKEESRLDSTFALIDDLARLKPRFMTVTYGAGGGTRQLTGRMVQYIIKKLGLPAVAHLTCVGHTVEELHTILQGYREDGVQAILALRGDPKVGEDVPKVSAFNCARDLVSFIAAKQEFSIAVAGYPEVHRDASSAQADLEYLKEKVDAGAELVITQLFFDNEAYFRFRDKANKQGITVPIVPGIMPIANVSQIRRFTEMCGASLPGSLLQELNRLGDDPASVLDFGTAYAIKQCGDLLAGGAPGLHLYTLNKSGQVKSIVDYLGRSD